MIVVGTFYIDFALEISNRKTKTIVLKCNRTLRWFEKIGQYWHISARCTCKYGFPWAPVLHFAFCTFEQLSCRWFETPWPSGDVMLMCCPCYATAWGRWDVTAEPWSIIWLTEMTWDCRTGGWVLPVVLELTGWTSAWTLPQGISILSSWRMRSLHRA